MAGNNEHSYGSNLAERQIATQRLGYWRVQLICAAWRPVILSVFALLVWLRRPTEDTAACFVKADEFIQPMFEDFEERE